MARQARRSSDPDRQLLERLERRPLTLAEATRGLVDGQAALQRLVAAGLVAAVPPKPPQRTPRYALTDEGRREIERPEAAVGPDGGPPWVQLADRVEALSARLDALGNELRELAARVDALGDQWRAAAARLEAVERLVGRDGRAAGEAGAAAGGAVAGGAAAGGQAGYGGAAASGAAVSAEEFERLLYRAYDELDRRQGRLGLVPIPRLREALAGRVAPDEFERRLRELAKSRRIFLVPHDQPSALSEAERRASIEDRVLGQLYYWVRWKG